MANAEQLAILKQGVEVWNMWRKENPYAEINLREANLSNINLSGANLSGVSLYEANLSETNLSDANLIRANLIGAYLRKADLRRADLSRADLRVAPLWGPDFSEANLREADLSEAYGLEGSNWWRASVGYTIFGRLDLSNVKGLEDVHHLGPSRISTDTFALSEGKIPETFLRGCGLLDWEIEGVKLHIPDLSNDEINGILYKIYSLRASQALQISPLFISYTHLDSEFVDKLESHLNEKGIRFWRDIHDMKAGRIEKQIDRAVRQNPTVLLVLSEHSLGSDWVEHEVHIARELAKELGRDTLCPVALDESWKSNPWSKRIMEQIMEYNILDFADWQDDVNFEGMFHKLIDGLELFYKG